MRPFHDSFFVTSGTLPGNALTRRPCVLPLTFMMTFTRPAHTPSTSVWPRRAGPALVVFIFVSNSWFIFTHCRASYVSGFHRTASARLASSLVIVLFPWVVRGRVELPTSTLSV